MKSSIVDALWIATSPGPELRGYSFPMDRFERARVVAVHFRVALLISQRPVEPRDALPLEDLYGNLSNTHSREYVDGALFELEKQGLLHYRIQPDRILIAMGPIPQPDRAEILAAVEAVMDAVSANQPKNAMLLTKVYEQLGEEYNDDQIAAALRAAEMAGDLVTFDGAGGQRYVRLTRRPESTDEGRGR
jgi:hypothetical protein